MKNSVLLVDDDEDTVTVFSEYLKLKGLRVVGKAHNGLEAVILYEKLRPDFIILDVMMPEYDGFYALENIRKNFPNSKFVMVTGDATDITQRKLADYGVSGIIYKPYDIDEVLKVMRSLKEGQAVYPLRW